MIVEKSNLETNRYTIVDNLLKKYHYKDIEKEIIKKYLSFKNIDIEKSDILKRFVSNQVEQPNFDNFPIFTVRDIEKYFELLTSFEERKSRGIFFTPAHIAKYIVENISPKENDKNLDPACGCGVFLIELIEFYRKKYKKSIKEIVRENIYGVDIQQANIDRSKAILAIYAFGNGEILKEDDFNLKCADSLLCDWNTLFNINQFDNIIGNPPYISREYGLFQLKEKEYKEKFACIKGIYDTFALFVELSIRLLKKNGKNSFILPTTFFVNDSFELIRKEFLKYDILLLKNIDEYVFDNVIVPTSIYVLQKSSKLQDATIDRNGEKITIQKHLIIGEKNIVKTDIDFKFAKKIATYKKYVKTKIGNYLIIKEAIKTGNDKKFVSKNMRNGYSIPLLKGKHIHSFKIKGCEYLSKDVFSLKRKIPKSIFECSKKLYIRRVANRIICALDTNRHYALHTLYFAILNKDYEKFTDLYEIFELLLNSNFYSKLYKTEYPFKGKLFTEIRTTKLKSLIVPNISTLLSHKEELLNIRKKIMIDKENSIYYDKLDNLIKKMFDEDRKVGKSIVN